jgi:hypothetical protein
MKRSMAFSARHGPLDEAGGVGNGADVGSGLLLLLAHALIAIEITIKAKSFAR